MSKKASEIKKGDIIKVKGENHRVTKVTKTEGGEPRISSEGVKGHTHHQKIYDPNEEVK
ncbi:MAG: hypothetical protein ACREOB_04535 [Thermodesulfobacteriota bacterium]